MGLKVTLIFTCILLFHNISMANSSLSIRAVGDVMLGVHENQIWPQHDFFSNLKSELQSADITFGNYEGTLCDVESKRRKTGWSFKTPTHLVTQLKGAGFDVMSIANNHIFDFYEVCAEQTREVLRSQKILPSGLLDKSRDQDNSFQNILSGVAVTKVNDLKVAFASFNYANSFNRLISILDLATAKKLIAKLDQDFDIVVVSMHAGAEGVEFRNTLNETEFYFGENRGNMVQFARMAIDAGADLIIGHGPHVLRALEVYRDRLIIYSLGNFATYTHFALNFPLNLGAIVEANLDSSGRLISGKIISTHQYWTFLKNGQRDKVVLDYDKKQRALYEIKSLSELNFPNSAPQFEGNAFYP
jgi:poly-gamma-glutamate capsule biosynthesis protein CapA/YwtB (metallophosphatase superfamily)